MIAVSLEKAEPATRAPSTMRFWSGPRLGAGPTKRGAYDVHSRLTPGSPPRPTKQFRFYNGSSAAALSSPAPS